MVFGFGKVKQITTLDFYQLLENQTTFYQ